MFTQMPGVAHTADVQVDTQEIPQSIRLSWQRRQLCIIAIPSQIGKDVFPRHLEAARATFHNRS
eukprot:3972673-Pyramimonas_sp.AAC.1